MCREILCCVNISLTSPGLASTRFIELNPNGRIPTLTDRSRNNFNVFETGAILIYLAQHYDKKKRFTFDPVTELDDYSEMLQWLFFAVSSFPSQPSCSAEFL